MKRTLIALLLILLVTSVISGILWFLWRPTSDVILPIILLAGYY